MANERFTNAINYKEQNIPPIWMMRQAGRYHSHYQNLRAKYSFMELCKIPEIAAEVALGPVQDFDFDLAILFSDLLFPLEGLGMGLKFLISCYFYLLFACLGFYFFIVSFLLNLSFPK